MKTAFFVWYHLAYIQFNYFISSQNFFIIHIVNLLFI